MFPSVLAIGSSLAGVKGALKINAVIGLLGLLAFYAFGKQLVGRKGALLAAIFLAFNPSQLWNARITQTELLSQFLFFAAAAAFVIGYRQNRASITSITGVLLGLSCFNRIDSYIFGLGIYISTAYIILVQRKKAGLFLSTAFTYTLLTVLSLAYGFIYRFPYYGDIWAGGNLKLLVLANIAFALLIPMAAAIRFLLINRKPAWSQKMLHGFIRLKRGKLALWATIVFFALLLFAYFVRPVYFNNGFLQGTEEFFTANALAEFGFYVPLIAILLALLGLYHIIRDKGFHPYLIFLSISLASIFIYFYKPSITPDHPWASRRWISVNIPAMLLLSVYGLKRIKLVDKRVNDMVKTAVAAVIIVLTLVESGLFMFSTMLQGYSTQMAEVAAALDPEKAYYTNSYQLITPLIYLYDKKVYLLRSEDLPETMAEYIKEEGPVYGIGWPTIKHINTLFMRGISIENVSSHILSGRYPELSYGYYPRQLIQQKYDASVRQLDYSPENLYYTYSLTTDFLTQNGIPKGESLVSNGQAGFLAYGNYTTLDPGKYEITFTGSLSDGMTEDNLKEDAGTVDISNNKGTQLLTEEESLLKFIDDGKLNGSIAFTLDQGAADLELRIFIGENIPLTIDKIVLHKVR
jgi:hypothetical protein